MHPLGSSPHVRAPKAMWPAVTARLHLIHDHPQDTLPDTFAHLDAARANILAYADLPKGLVAADIVKQPQRTSQPRNPEPNRQRQNLPHTRRYRPPRLSRLSPLTNTTTTEANNTNLDLNAKPHTEGPQASYTTTRDLPLTPSTCASTPITPDLARPLRRSNSVSCLREVQTISRRQNIRPTSSLTRPTTLRVHIPTKNTTKIGHNEPPSQRFRCNHH